MLTKKFTIAALTAAFFTSLSLTANAVDLDGFGKLSIDGRYRYEHVDEEGREHNANANTARLRIGYETPTFYETLKGYIEWETVRHLGPRDFNDGLPARPDWPTVNDPEMDGINQAYLDYNGGDVKLRVGRQLLNYDNQRWVGSPRWRQNDVSFDAAYGQYSPVKQITLQYAHAINVLRGAYDRAPSGEYEGHMDLLNARYNFNDAISLSAFSYLLDFYREEDNLSSQTYGLRLNYDPKGDDWLPIGGLEFARQSDYGHSNLSYAENFYGIELGAKKKDLKILLAYDSYGSNGAVAMQTPVASTHDMRGWSEKFGTIPAEGLNDLKLTFSAPVELPWEDQKLTVFGMAHRMTSVEESLHYGDDVGLGVTYSPIKDHSITAKFSHYTADDRFTDTDKIWLYYDVKF